MSTFLAIPEMVIGSLPLSSLDTYHNLKGPDVPKFIEGRAPEKALLLPQVLCVRTGGRWSRETNKEVISQIEYLYVSYCKANFIDTKRLEDTIKDACSRLRLNAYWIDYACISGEVGTQLQILQRMCDIIKGATKTLLLDGGEYASPKTPQWVLWGRRLWTLPELILSRNLVRPYLGKYVDTDGRTICKMAYKWEIQDIETKLVYFYSEGHKKTSHIITYNDLVQTLINVIWKNNGSETMTNLPEEKTYALMSILLYQTEPVVGAELSFKTLIKRNNLPLESFPYPAETGTGSVYKESEAFKPFIIPVQFFIDTPDTYYPNKIIWRDSNNDRWVPSYNKQLHGQHYLAVSYRQDPRMLKNIEKELQYLSWITFGHNAYWFDYCCMSGAEFPACMDLYHMADIYLRAKTTLIMLPSVAEDGSDGEELIWSEWGQSVWSIVETLLSSKLYYRIRGRDTIRVTKREVFQKAFNEDPQHNVLVDIAEGKSELPKEEIWAYLINAIWKKSVTISGNISVADHTSETPGKLTLPNFKAEKVYALMMFMPIRIFPDVNETEDEAMSRLLNANQMGSGFRAWLSDWCRKNIPGQSHLSHLYEKEDSSRMNPRKSISASTGDKLQLHPRK